MDAPMSKYRCPACGAGHKSEAEKCRLCGQSLVPGAMVAAPVQTVQVTHAKKGNKGPMLIGIGLVVGVMVVAVVFGIVKPTAQLNVVKGKLTDAADGWTPEAGKTGMFTVELPSPRLWETEPFGVTDDHTISAWTADIGSDTALLAGWGKVAPPLTDGAITPTAAYRYLKEDTVPRWMAENGMTKADATVDETGLAGLPAVVVTSTQPRGKLDGKEAYVHAVFALNKGTLYVLRMTSIYKDPAQLNRMVKSFAVTGTVA
jgi:hypothetical protein